MLFRGDTPLTEDERVDYETERFLFKMQNDGLLLLKRMDPTGPVWNPTLRGLRERDCPLGCFRS
jgi:hypothetical protein